MPDWRQQRTCAEVVVHIDLPMKDWIPRRINLPEWHFIKAMALAGELVHQRGQAPRILVPTV